MYLPTESRPGSAPADMLLCYITDRSQFSGGAEEKERRLLAKIAECAAAGVDLVQLREKDLSARRLEELAHRAASAIPAGCRTRLLINSRTDVALACGAHGVHLPANDLPASEVRVIMSRAGKTTPAPVIGASAHSPQEVTQAEAHGADFAVFGPVFEKNGQLASRGLNLLRQVCHRPPIDGARMPVLALGGVTLANAQECFAAGAAGIAAIRLFQQNQVEQIVSRLRAMVAQ